MEKCADQGSVLFAQKEFTEDQFSHSRRYMTKRRKRKAAVPDEAFVAGPLRLARYGSNVVFESDWSEREHVEMRLRAVEEHSRLGDCSSLVGG